MIDHELYKLDMYGILPNSRVSYLNHVFKKMLERGLIAEEMVYARYGKLPTIKITEKGKSFLEGNNETHIDFVQELADKDVVILDAEEEILFKDLKQIRRDLAVEEEIPAYMICNTICLREMAKSKPETESELLDIQGIGEKFIQKYGKFFLSVLNRYLSREVIV